MKTIGIIGSGNLGTHMTQLFCKNNLEMFLTVSDKSITKANTLAYQHDIESATNLENIRMSDIIFLTVKPNNIKDVCEEIKNNSTYYCEAPKLIISAAAGVSVSKIQKWVGNRHSVGRCMPNIPVSIGDGSIVWTRGSVNTDDIELLNDITNGPGSLWVGEEMMDSATVISGCSPAYTAKFFNTNYKIGIEMGFSPEQSKELLFNSMSGFLKLIKTMSPDEIMNQVASKGGATEKGLEMMDKDGFSEIVRKSLFSSLDRIEKITKSLD